MWHATDNSNLPANIAAWRFYDVGTAYAVSHLAFDRLNVFAQCRAGELPLANRKREPLRASESALIEGIGEVVTHDGCSLLNEKDANEGCVRRRTGEPGVLERQPRRAATCGILLISFGGGNAGFFALRRGGEVGGIRGRPLVGEDSRTQRRGRIEHGGDAGTCRFLGHGKSDFHGETAEIF
jgi:hypothetical protein